MPSKSYAYLLNFEQINLIFLKTHKTEFDNIIIKFTDQNNTPSKIEDKVNLTLPLTNRNNMLFDKTKKKKLFLRIWIFVTCKRSI